MSEAPNEWKEVTDGEVIKLEPNEAVEGEYQSCKPSAKFSDGFALRIKALNGNVCVFVNNIVADKILLARISVGDRIRLEYLGMKKNEAGTREYKDYKLFSA